MSRTAARRPRLQLKSKSKWRLRGATMTELLISLPIVIFMVLAVVQLALIYRARLTLENAAAEAARAGALNNGQPLPFVATLNALNVSKIGNAVLSNTSNVLFRGSVWQGMVNGLTPLNTASPDVGALVAGWRDTHAELIDAGCIEYLNPTQQTFIDWGFVENVGENRWMLQIPNDTLRYRKPLAYDFQVKVGTTFGEDSSKAPTPPDRELRGNVSHKTLQEANVLHLRLHYGYALKVPIVGPAILQGYTLARGAEMNQYERAMVQHGRLPLSAEGSEGMQTALTWHPFYAFGPASSDRGALDRAMSGIRVSGSDALSKALEAPGDIVTQVTAFIHTFPASQFRALLATGVDGLGSAVGNGNAFCPAVWNARARIGLHKVPNSAQPGVEP